MADDYMLHEAEEAAKGERLYGMGSVWYKQADGSVVRVWDDGELGRTGQDRVPARSSLDLAAAVVLRDFWDAAYPPFPSGFDGAAGYVGGGTPHPWTEAEWNKVSGFRLPIFVRVPPTTRDPVAEANFLCDWSEAHGQPHGTLVALDYETSTVVEYLDRFDAQVTKRGYKLVVYGSRRTVMTLPEPSGGYWTATWNNIPHLDAGATLTQYGGDVTLGKPYDANVAAGTAPLWTPGEDMTKEEHDALIEARNLLKLLVYGDRKGEGWDTHDFISMEGHYALLKGLASDVGAVKALVEAGGVDVPTLAANIAQDLGPTLTAKLADELAARLAA